MKRRSLHCFVVAICLIAGSRASVAQDEIFVTNNNSNAVTVYAFGANGNVAPLRTLAGPATGLANPSGVAVDLVNDELLVVNKTPPYSVTIYARTASGNQAPLRTITGGLTDLNDPRGISVDSVHGEFAVANRAGFSITTFPRLATGNQAPARTLQTMGLSQPWGVVIDVPHDEILVANNGNFISVFERIDNGTVAPLRTISGSNTGFNAGPIGLTLEGTFDEIAVTNPFTGPGFEPAVLFFPRIGAGNISPSAAIGGNPATTGLVSPNGLAAARGLLFVPSSGADSIVVHQRLSTGVAPPLRRIIGPSTLLNNPQFVAITTNLFADGFENP